MKECCETKGNLKMDDRDNDKTVKQCIVCGCRHFGLTVDVIQAFSQPAKASESVKVY